jgi:Lactate racemase N-terminal domain
MLSPTFPAVHLPHLEHIELPPVRRVRLHHPGAEPVADVEGAVRAAMEPSRRLAELPQGARVAVAVGSRGVAEIPVLVRTVVAHLKGQGLDPFIVPAMGSHGGGTAEGQVGVLKKLGVTEESIGAPVRATMETVEYGATLDGIPCRFDANAAKADAVVLIARVKSHTSFDRPVESGLTKMIAVGLGKQAGARNVHRLGPRGYIEVLPALARIALEHGKIAYGIAVVENSSHKLVTIEGVEPEQFLATDERLLKRAKELLARLPFAQIDGLIVERIGKEISGTGMDIAVSGRADIRGVTNPKQPFIHKLAVLGLSDETAGNAIGLGVADFTTIKVANALDLVAMYMNSITATTAEKARLPIVLPDDRTAIRAVVATCWATELERVRLCQIRSSMDLDEILVSPALFEDLDGSANAEALSDPEPLAFAADGRLLTRA